VSTDRMLIGSINNQLVLHHAVTGELIDDIDVGVFPGGICMYECGNAAVALPDEKTVLLISVNDEKLTIRRRLRVNGMVFDITPSDNNLVVVYPICPWLEVISTGGDVLHQFKGNGETQPFQYPDCLTSTNDGYIYLADHGTSTVSQLDGRLNLLQNFTDPMLEKPRGITAVSDDQLIVCNFERSNIVLLRPSTGKMSTLLIEKDGVAMLKPMGVSYCPESKTIYVLNRYGGHILIYEKK